MQSFYNIFEYSHMMHDAIDGGLVYEEITITKDIETVSGKKLVKGTKFDACWFLFVDQVFQFINWEPAHSSSNEIKAKGVVEIPQAELAPYLFWYDAPSSKDTAQYQAFQEVIKKLNKLEICSQCQQMKKCRTVNFGAGFILPCCDDCSPR